MNIRILQGLLLIIAIVTVAHAQDSNKLITLQTEVLKKTVSSLNLETPEKDVKTNTEKDDLRFICVCGYACETPGVQKNDLSFPKKYGTRCLEGTSDMIESEEHGQLIQAATQYAKRYNAALLQRLKGGP